MGYCELNPEDTYATNTKSVEHAVAIASELDIPLLYISTAGIINGEKELYDDWDKPEPIGHYARSKYMAEKYVKEHAVEHLICRAGWMMGGGPGKDKKFIQKLMSQIQNSAKKLNIVLDKMGTPTYTHDFARNVKLLIEKGKTGLYNMVCQGVTSCLEVAQKLLKQLGLNGDIKINEVSSDHFNQEYFRSSTDSLT